MSPVLGDADKVYVGSQVVDRAYLGANRVYPTFVPTDIAGLLIWMDASQLAQADGAAVSSWPNLAVPAKPGVLAGTAPVAKTGANGINGKRVVRFTAGQGSIYRTDGGVAATWTVCYVARMWGATKRRVLAGYYPHASAPNALIGWWGGYEDKLYVGAWASPDPTTAAGTTPKLYSCDGTGAVARLFRNGVLYSSTGGHTGFGGTYEISPSGGMAESSDCDVAEICWYNVKLSDVDRQKVELYLRKKWAIT